MTNTEGMAIINRLVIFGDSNTDNGNLLSLSNGVSPGPHNYKGRYCDGLVWSDIIDSKFNLELYSNSAYGGATLNNENLARKLSPDTNILIPGGKQQIDEFLKTADLRYEIDNAHRTLHVIFVASNDFTAGLYPEKFKISRILTEQEMAVETLKLANQLVESVSAKHILIFGVRPKSEFPGLVKYFNEGERAKIRNQAELFNSLLKTQIELTKSSSNSTAQVMYYDIYSLMETVRLNLAKYGLSPDTQTTIVDIKSSSNGNNTYPTDPTAPNNELMFWDDFHVGKQCQAVLADDILQFLATNSISFK